MGLSLSNIGSHNEAIDNYKSALSISPNFLDAQNKELYPNLYSIKYEDFFPNNYEKLRHLADEIGLEYAEDIFCTRSKAYLHWRNIDYNNIDIRNYTKLEKLFVKYRSKIKCIIHSAAQPSHDWAVKNPKCDFTINALGTLNLLELTKKYCPDAVFIFVSTNKVYGDTPNHLPLKENNSGL